MLKYLGVSLFCLVTVSVCKPAPDYKPPGVCAWKCPITNRPVCGSNQRTYENMCELHRARCQKNNVEFAYQGKCKSKCPNIDCPDDTDLLCGTDGITYRNRCLMFEASLCKSRGVRTAYRGECRE